MYDRTLLEAIDEGIVPRPGLLTYQAWNAWRAREGQRPSKRRHGDEGRTTTTAEEAKLWRKVMATLYGPEWQDQLAMAGAPPEESSEEGERSEGSMGTAPEEALVEEARAATGAEQATDLVPVGPASAASSTVGGESVFQDLSLQRLQETLAKDFRAWGRKPGTLWQAFKENR